MDMVIRFPVMLFQVAIYGKNFCVSAKNAFSLILRNIIRVAVVDKVTDFVLFISRLVIMGAVGRWLLIVYDMFSRACM